MMRLPTILFLFDFLVKQLNGVHTRESAKVVKLQEQIDTLKAAQVAANDEALKAAKLAVNIAALAK